MRSRDAETLISDTDAGKDSAQKHLYTRKCSQGDRHTEAKKSVISGEIKSVLPNGDRTLLRNETAHWAVFHICRGNKNMSLVLHWHTIPMAGGLLLSYGGGEARFQFPDTHHA